MTDAETRELNNRLRTIQFDAARRPLPTIGNATRREELIAYVESLLAAERERCKGLCDQMYDQYAGSPAKQAIASELSENIRLGSVELGRAAIRQRSAVSTPAAQSKVGDEPLNVTGGIES